MRLCGILAVGQCLLLALVFDPVSPACASVEDVRAQADSVHLVFGWRPGMSAHVIASMARSRTEAPPPALGRPQVAWRMTVGEHPRGLIVRRDSVRVERDDPSPSILRALLVAAASSPGIIVSREGGFLDVEEPSEHRQHALALMDSLAQGLPEYTSGVRDGLAAMMTDESIRSTAVEFWNAIAGYWSVGAGRVGEVRDRPLSGARLESSESESARSMRFRISPSSACGDATLSGCVELGMKTFTESQTLPKTVPALLKRLKAPDVDSTLTRMIGMKTETEVTAVVRPRDLLPVSVMMRKEVTMTMSGSASPLMTQHDEWTWSFWWTP